jgi:taurine dioxygenase
MFVSMSAAFDGLSDRMQRYICGLVAIHDMKPFRPLFDQSLEDRKKLQQFELMYPPQLHPVVRVHPVSGRKVLFVNPQFTIAIEGMEECESCSLLDTLFHQALIPEYQFRLNWEPHTIAMWDNRSTQHYAIHDYYPQRRYMERVTIRGDAVIGVERADPATVRKSKYVAPKNVDVQEDISRTERWGAPYREVSGSRPGMPYPGCLLTTSGSAQPAPPATKMAFLSLSCFMLM